MFFLIIFIFFYKKGMFMRYVVVAENRKTSEKFILGNGNTFNLWTWNSLDESNFDGSKMKNATILVAHSYEEAKKFFGYVVARCLDKNLTDSNEPTAASKYNFYIRKIDSFNFPYIISKNCGDFTQNLTKRVFLKKVAKYGNFDLDWLKNNNILNLTKYAKVIKKKNVL